MCLPSEREKQQHGEQQCKQQSSHTQAAEHAGWHAAAGPESMCRAGMCRYRHRYVRQWWQEVWAHLARIPRCPLCPPHQHPPAQCRAMPSGRCRSGSTPAVSTASCRLHLGHHQAACGHMPGPSTAGSGCPAESRQQAARPVPSRHPIQCLGGNNQSTQQTAKTASRRQQRQPADGSQDCSEICQAGSKASRQLGCTHEAGSKGSICGHAHPLVHQVSRDFEGVGVGKGDPHILCLLALPASLQPASLCKGVGVDTSA